MPNDAKFGLIVGVGLVIAVAVVFFQRSDSTDTTAALPAAGAAADEIGPGQRNGRPERRAQTPPPHQYDDNGTLTGRSRFIPAQESDRIPNPREQFGGSWNRRHVIEEGDTLFSLARRYYGDGERFIDIYRANRSLIPNPDRLPVGTSLYIP